MHITMNPGYVLVHFPLASMEGASLGRFLKANPKRQHAEPQRSNVKSATGFKGRSFWCAVVPAGKVRFGVAEADQWEKGSYSAEQGEANIKTDWVAFEEFFIFIHIRNKWSLCDGSDPHLCGDIPAVLQADHHWGSTLHQLRHNNRQLDYSVYL